jgi:hypothetical protein
MSDSGVSPPSDPNASSDDIPLGFGGVSASVGDHIAHFYRGASQRFSVLGPYIETGLRRGDRCVFISAPDVADDLREWLAAHDVDVEQAEDSGLLILDPGRATKEDMIDLVARVDRESQAQGCSFVRWSGDASWALDGDISVHSMLHWEALYDEMSPDLHMLALCQFDQSHFSGDVLMDALRSHPYCVMGQVVVPNPFHESPETLIEELSEKEEDDASASTQACPTNPA